MSLSQSEEKTIRPILEGFVTALLRKRPQSYRARVRLRRVLNELRPGLDLDRLHRTIVHSEPKFVEMVEVCWTEENMDRLVNGMMERLGRNL